MPNITIYSRIFAFFIAISFLDPALIYSQDNTLVEIIDIYPKDLRVAGFALTSKQEIAIEAIGFSYRSYDYKLFMGNAWILDSESREVVWDLSESSSRRSKRGTLEFMDKVSLPKGIYEVYYASYPLSRDFDLEDIGDILGSFFRDWFNGDRRSSRREMRGFYKEFQVVIKGDGKSLSRNEIYDIHEKLKNESLVWISGYKKNLYKSVGFVANKPVELEVYSIGEFDDREQFDYGYIQDAISRKKVWDLSYRKSKYAGGAEKNRMRKDTIKLPAGKYAVIYATDGTHSSKKWNAQPPYDPEFWGISVVLKNKKDKKNIEFFEYEDFMELRTIVDMTRVRNNESKSYGFTLKKDMDINIYAVGEGRRGEMFDFGWIIDANNRERIWEMEFRDTEHSGGASKNRVYDDVISLKKGDYIAYYVTDGSHSYRMWNSSPPSDQKAWGMRLIAVDTDFNSKDVWEYKEDDKNILARIVNIGDDELISERFRLRERTRIRIYAIGEGSGGEMYDYGWIEDSRTGRTVWEMSYRRTEHAGGAKKNRMFDGTIVLKPGEYVIKYETDGSHSFNDWNDSQPYDPFNWGITVTAVSE
ncbi:MAG: hypothetical protein IIB39_00855 [Candidatus Marinimicrobia bacterium]|nr:hypothetical protein [Candidatus Neomarinimicrobiota bacterium]